MEVHNIAHHNIIQDTISEENPLQGKICRKAKWLSEEGLQIAEKRREVKGKGERERYIQLNADFQSIAMRDKKAFVSEQCKEIGKILWIRLEISSRKLEIPRDHFMQT